MAVITTLHSSKALKVLDYRCTAGPGDRPYTEMFAAHSVAYIRKGSFGCRTHGRAFELVAGSVMAGRAGEEYRCTHEHHAGGDECLCVQFSESVAEVLGGAKPWRGACLPPVAELIVQGELLQATACGATDVGVDEAGLLLVAAYARYGQDKEPGRVPAGARHRRRAVEAALWIDENSAHEMSLEAVARKAGLSAFHFLRVFAKVLGVTPHQYLLRSRLRHAARLLAEGERAVTEVALDVGFADLSNFVRSFRRAAGVSPGGFRRVARGRRNFVQERIARAA